MFSVITLLEQIKWSYEGGGCCVQSYVDSCTNNSWVDLQLWKLPFAQVLYDTDPATPGKSEQKQAEEMSQAMIR